MIVHTVRFLLDSEDDVETVINIANSLKAGRRGEVSVNMYFIGLNLARFKKVSLVVILCGFLLDSEDVQTVINIAQ